MSDGFERFDRYARPIGRHLGWVYILGGILFLGGAGAIFLFAMWRWSIGQLAINWTEIGALVAAMGGAAATLVNVINNLNAARHAERIEQIRVGASPPPLSAQPPQQPEAGGENFEGVNPHGGPGAP